MTAAARHTARALFCLLFLAVLSAGCGRKGDLVRPGQHSQISDVSTSPLHSKLA